jgi:hypothetical protein
MRNIRMMGSWVLALFLGMMFLWIADLTLFPPAPGKNVVFPLLAESSGIYLWEPTGRLAVGLLHAIAALLLIVPWTRRIGAVLALIIALGAVAAHVLWLDVAIPTEFGSTATDGGQLFYLAIALASASLALAFIHPGRPASNGQEKSSAPGYYAH